MAVLNEDAKAFIVQSLACYQTPSQVAEAVKQEFDIQVSRQQCECYHPEKHLGRKLSRKWRELFAEARAKFKAGAVDVPVASRVYRLKMLERHAIKADLRGNSMLMAALLEQAAKEVGDAYVNRRMDPPKAPGDDEPKTPAEDYRILRPDENVPPKPIL